MDMMEDDSPIPAKSRKFSVWLESISKRNACQSVLSLKITLILNSASVKSGVDSNKDSQNSTRF
jgi:hypothetical protein